VARAITAANHYAADSVTRLGTQTSYIDREAFTRIYPEFAQIGE
jgi:ribokinase